MAETISMPKLGFDMAEGTLVRWVKNEGENVNKGDVLAEIETDKATVEVESSASGVVRKLLVEEGSVVPIGNPIAIVGSADEKIDEVPAKVSEPKAEKKTDEKAGEELKTESEAERGKKEGPKAQETAPVTQTQPAAASVAQAAAPTQEGPVKASPLAKKIARDNKVDLARLQGSGPGGRVVRKDVEAALSGGLQATERRPQAVVSGPPSVVAVPREDETIQLTKLRQAIARRMTESKTSVPHFYVTHEYKLDALMAMRKQINDYLPEDEKLSVNDFIIKAVALTLHEFPNLNASFDGDKVVHHGAVNVGVAVAVEGGLLTVVNRNTDQQPLRAISSDVKRMVAGAREGKVRPNDIEGSTFSISNMGMYDVENFFAIINPPEAGILAVGSAREVPVVENGEVKVGWRMKATISVDHRVSDGVEGARFMQKLAEFLENPVRMLV
ncbi:MAG TPA: dihydrolipoamide acetyltransferase family protein [Anaerolineales bacterium]|nr:dihydrolipoamide acetyltransferase family protein [Anaerolineales bacterium]